MTELEQSEKDDSAETAPEHAKLAAALPLCGLFGPLPGKVDSEGSNAEKPSWGRLAALPAYLVVMLVIGVAAIALGQGLIGLAFVLFAIVPSVAIVVVAKVRLPDYLGHLRGTSYTPNPLGAWLGGTAASLKAWAPTLLSEEIEILEANRAKEAEATTAWLARVGETACVGEMARTSETERARETARATEPCPAVAEPLAPALGLAQAFERVEMTSDDGTTLVGHLLTCRPASSHWVILAPGYRGSWTDGMLHARRYADKGFNLLLIDMRAQGESGGAWVGLGWLDRRDLVAWASWLTARCAAGMVSSRADAGTASVAGKASSRMAVTSAAGEAHTGPAAAGMANAASPAPGDSPRIVLHGTGMGAAAALLASAEPDLPSTVCVCVADSAYTNAWNVALPLLGGDAKTSAHPMVDLMRLALCTSEGGYDVARACPEAAVAAARVPVLLFHGDQDTLVPPYMAYRLVGACGGVATGDAHMLVMAEGAGHAQAALADPVGYYWRLFTFIGRYL